VFNFLEPKYLKNISKRIYVPRLVGYNLGFILLCVNFYQYNVGIPFWIYLIGVTFSWPHLAYYIATHSNNQKKAEFRNLTIDAFLMGMTLPMMSFRLLPSLTIAGMSLLTSIAAGGFSFLVRGVLFFILGTVVLIPFLGLHVNPESTLFIEVFCLPPLIIYSMAIASATYNLAKKYDKARENITSQKVKLEDAYEEIKRQRDILDNLSKIDGLTGIPNRRRFDEYMDLQWENAQRSKSPLSVIMIDIDHFKAYNDFYGHGGGDECLKKVATRLSETINRPNDIIARYGGEEFVCLLPATELQGAISLAEDMRKNIISQSIPHEKSPISNYVSISLGVSSINPIKESTPSILLETADKALYEAKNGTRNCVMYKLL
jgi:diguanylate cyclase (GGDEF)-like protein